MAEIGVVSFYERSRALLHWNPNLWICVVSHLRAQAMHLAGCSGRELAGECAVVFLGFVKDASEMLTEGDSNRTKCGPRDSRRLSIVRIDPCAWLREPRERETRLNTENLCAHSWSVVRVCICHWRARARVSASNGSIWIRVCRFPDSRVSREVSRVSSLCCETPRTQRRASFERLSRSIPSRPKPVSKPLCVCKNPNIGIPKPILSLCRFSWATRTCASVGSARRANRFRKSKTVRTLFRVARNADTRESRGVRQHDRSSDSTILLSKREGRRLSLSRARLARVRARVLDLLRDLPPNAPTSTSRL